ncbi:hypothetical protein GCM10011395_14110 [Sphingomonas psychrolutea]|uniref:Uncharacterized protein n=1 Tax=Sphingomonas psychrolutea TaxID=1259676 RepID=A0ABQ1GJH9_9SPHN|nr:hypothetical protein GCM10011395_14110 [Sphingomonas psychrolutea]
MQSFAESVAEKLFNRPSDPNVNTFTLTLDLAPPANMPTIGTKLAPLTRVRIDTNAATVEPSEIVVTVFGLPNFAITSDSRETPTRYSGVAAGTGVGTGAGGVGEAACNATSSRLITGVAAD